MYRNKNRYLGSVILTISIENCINYYVCWEYMVFQTGQPLFSFCIWWAFYKSRTYILYRVPLRRRSCKMFGGEGLFSRLTVTIFYFFIVLLVMITKPTKLNRINKIFCGTRTLLFFKLPSSIDYGIVRVPTKTIKLPRWFDFLSKDTYLFWWIL